MSDVDLLIEMGFPREKAEKALSETGNNGIESAMEWLLARQDAAEEESKKSAEETQAKSLKCNECGKLFKSTDEVEYHAVKSGHSDFAESTEEKKPLTEEEKRQQLKLLEEKMRQKRLEREAKEKTEAIEREKKRIQSGKELSAIREKLRDEEMRKMVEQRKREKEEDAKARARVKAQIEADRAARKFKMGEAPVAAQPPPASPPVVTEANKEYRETRLQIRLTNGSALTQTFGAKEQLAAVRVYIEMNRTDSAGPFGLMTNFPKKIFDEDDFEKPLDSLGLVPSAVLIVTKK